MSKIAITRLNAQEAYDSLGKVHEEHTDEPSLTIVEKCYTIDELLQRAVQGLPLNVVHREYPPTGEYTGEEDLDSVSSSEFDLSDDDLVNLCAAKRMSLAIERELRNRKDKPAEPKGGSAGSSAEPIVENTPPIEQK